MTGMGLRGIGPHTGVVLRSGEEDQGVLKHVSSSTPEVLGLEVHGLSETPPGPAGTRATV